MSKYNFRPHFVTYGGLLSYAAAVIVTDGNEFIRIESSNKLHRTPELAFEEAEEMAGTMNEDYILSEANAA